MKKLLLVFLLGTFISAQAQTTLTTAVDFTATDIDGNTFNLFNKLGEGKYVLLDFMFTQCGPCITAAPKLHEAFMNYGANSPSAQVYFVSINRDDNNAVMHTSESTNMNPTGPYPLGVSGTQGSATAGAQTFHIPYGIGGFPTMILIAPDKQVLENDIWPISTAADFTPYFQAHGITPSPAGLNNVSSTANGVSLFPSPASESISIIVNGKKMNGIRIVDILGNVVINQHYENSPAIQNIDISNLNAGIYFAEVQINNTDFVVKKFIKE